MREDGEILDAGGVEESEEKVCGVVFFLFPLRRYRVACQAAQSGVQGFQLNFDFVFGRSL